MHDGKQGRSDQNSLKNPFSSDQKTNQFIVKVTKAVKSVKLDK